MNEYEYMQTMHDLPAPTAGSNLQLTPPSRFDSDKPHWRLRETKLVDVSYSERRVNSSGDYSVLPPTSKNYRLLAIWERYIGPQE